MNTHRIVQVRWPQERIPAREQLFRGLEGALAALTGEPASPAVCVDKSERPGGEYMVCATTLTDERWSIRAGAAELSLDFSPITSSTGVTGEYLYFRGAFRGMALLSAWRPGAVTVELGDGAPEEVAAAFFAPFGTLATPTDEERWALAVNFLRYQNLPEGVSSLQLLAELSELPLEDPRGALAQLWLGWQALGDGQFSEALGRFNPLVALGDTLKVAFDANVDLSSYPSRDGFRLVAYGEAQPPLAYALLGAGLALVQLGRRDEATAAVTRGLSLCNEKYPGACGAAARARAALEAKPS